LAHNRWPRCPAIYEIYPRSFLDTTGSGTGDLQGILDKLAYVAGLGVDAIWIAPFYPSSLKDGGYDIADHSGVSAAMGTEDTVRRIIETAHDKGLKVLTDQVINHTSDRNPWFEKSATRSDGFDDWYVWRDPKPDGTAPNNWMSYFGPPAWTWDHRREQYYWHQFLSSQPNLNLRNPCVQEALKGQMRYWRGLGVDGFRMDAISAYLHDETFADNPVASPQVRARVAGPSYSPYTRQDHTYDLLPGDGAAYCDRIRDWAGADAYLLGEINVGNHSVEIANSFTEEGRLDAAYTIDFPERGFTPQVIADVLERMAKSPTGGGGRFMMWLSSHDQARHASTTGDGSAQDARFLALACGCLPGPWLIYQGEELGLPQPELSRDETTDPYDLLFWPDGAGREGPRVPMPWTENAPTYGFTTGTPWLPMRWASGMSVAAQQNDDQSVLGFYHRLLALRRSHGFAEGDISDVLAEGDLLTLRLATGSAVYRCTMNFGNTQRQIDAAQGDMLLASGDGVTQSQLPARTAALWQLA
jgi:alpha-glucosidase